MDYSELENRAKILRRRTLDLGVEKIDAVHLGGAFSSIELLVSLYDVILRDKDTFILSKGHSCYPLYVLLRERGYNPKIMGHPEIESKEGIYATTGSLGHGLPQSVGRAFARKIKNEEGHIYVLLGDGEIQEGTTWESSLFAVQHKLDNLTAIVDYNKIQGSTYVNEVSPLGDLREKFKVLGWHTLEINGHSFGEIIPALKSIVEGKPAMVVAHTTKGKGVSFMENNPKWHGGVPQGGLLIKAYEELK